MKPDMIPSGMSLNDLHVQLRLEKCGACKLGQHPALIGPVLSQGSAKIPVMFLGEAPGKDEDATGLPFVGKAGKLLDDWLGYQDIDRNDVYITNCIKCRPIATPGSGKQNNTPGIEEIRTCKPYLLHEIQMIQPKLIVTLGMSALKATLTGDIEKITSLKQLVGKFYISTSKNRCRIPPGIVFYPTYHPAAFLHTRNEGMKEEMTILVKDHFKQIKEAINELQ